MCNSGIELLNDKELDVLLFVLQTTYERWTDDNDSQVGILADDPTCTDLDSLLEATAALSELPSIVKSIRDKLFAKESA